tara:strand:+ start:263 stop:511 length:249 start_codon:yes stop_codon:yes gene_type:complete
MEHRRFMEPVIGEYGFRTPDEATIMSDEMGIGPIHRDEIEGQVVFVPGKSREAFNSWVAQNRREQFQGMQKNEALARRIGGG